MQPTAIKTFMVGPAVTPSPSPSPAGMTVDHLAWLVFIPAKYISQCIDEIKQELKQDNIAVKANAVCKLTYLQMLGYDISWAAFNIIEVMSASKFTFKRIGYLAASQCFHEGTDVIMLTTNQIRKDLSSPSQYDTGVALTGLSCFVTPDLARDLANDIMTLFGALTPLEPRLGKKLIEPLTNLIHSTSAMSLLYECVNTVIAGERASRPVVSGLWGWAEALCVAVSVHCTSRESPAAAKVVLTWTCSLVLLWPHSLSSKRLLEAGPSHPYMLMTSTDSITAPKAGQRGIRTKVGLRWRQGWVPSWELWVLTRVHWECIRLHTKNRSRKSEPPKPWWLEQGQTTPMELFGRNYRRPTKMEAQPVFINGKTCVCRAEAHLHLLLQLCVQKLRILIEDSDQNLKYLGLLAMSKILKTHPKSVQSHKDLILQCLDDKDESIRLRALDLLYGMVSKKNLMEIVKKLMTHVDKAEGTTYRDELLTKIIDICSQSNYQYITNFEWYISILVELTRLEGTRHGHLIAAQMLDVAIRVKAIRKFAVAQMSALLDSAHLVTSSTQRNGICEVLYAAAWICGEFSQHLQEPQQTLEAMLRPKVTTLPGHIQAVYVQNVVKLYASVLQQQEQAGEHEAAQAATQLLVDRLPQFVQSADLEVQERASCILQLVKYIQKLQAKEVPVAEEVSALFAGELNPVAPKAQKKVPIPDGLDLDAWINEPPSDSESEDEAPKAIFHDEEHKASRHRQPEADEEELARRREARKQEQANNPFYIKSSPSPQKRYQDAPGVEHIPVVQIDLSVPLKVPGMPASDQYVKLEQERQHRQRLEKDRKRKKQKKEKRREGRHRRHSSLHTESDEDIAPAQQVDIVTEEMPENALPSDEDDKDPNDPYRALDIDLDKPLADSEKLPIQKHRNAETPQSPDKEAAPVLEKKSKKPKKKEKKLHREKERRKEKEKAKDLDFWLSTTPPPPAAPDPTPSLGEPEVDVVVVSAPTEEGQELRRAAPEDEDEEEHELDQKPSKHKKKKHKKEKEEKTKEKKKSRRKWPPSEEPPEEPVQNGSLEGDPLPPMSSYCLLAENAYIKMTYDVQGSLQKDSQVTVSLILENLSSSFLKSMELNVLDSLNTKMARPEGTSVHDGVPVPFQLPPGVSNEARFVFTVQSIVMAQKLKGTLSFIVKNDEGSTHEKLDFKLHFSCTSYLITTPCSSDAFAKLLESGDLGMSSIKVDGITMSFQNLLAKICFHHHFSVVERVDSCASMYSRSVQDHHVCLLLKKGENSVSVDGKCSDPILLGNLLDEMKVTLAQC
ncbi:AP-3 complex subunit delta-1 [Echinops telfairi]|uniref:AP-3 complex subunit delta-1 n=1 Tax=Echinops telfairi TaxID=9371 RepID=A0AC59C732_ECHTE|nr:AP-3 complex subunit delta-1 [Echinops telfairi]